MSSHQTLYSFQVGDAPLGTLKGQSLNRMLFSSHGQSEELSPNGGHAHTVANGALGLQDIDERYSASGIAVGVEDQYSSWQMASGANNISNAMTSSWATNGYDAFTTLIDGLEGFNNPWSQAPIFGFHDEVGQSRDIAHRWSQEATFQQSHNDSQYRPFSAQTSIQMPSYDPARFFDSMPTFGLDPAAESFEQYFDWSRYTSTSSAENIASCFLGTSDNVPASQSLDASALAASIDSDASCDRSWMHAADEPHSGVAGPSAIASSDLYSPTHLPSSHPMHRSRSTSPTSAPIQQTESASREVSPFPLPTHPRATSAQTVSRGTSPTSAHVKPQGSSCETSRVTTRNESIPSSREVSPSALPHSACPVHSPDTHECASGEPLMADGAYRTTIVAAIPSGEPDTAQTDTSEDISEDELLEPEQRTRSFSKKSAGCTRWYYTCSRMELASPQLTSGMEPGDLYIHQVIGKKAQRWVCTSASKWRRASLGMKHPSNDKRVLWWRSPTVPSWVLQHTYATYRGKAKQAPRAFILTE